MTDNELKKRYASARKKIIQMEFSRLNDMQREAVTATEGPLLILAGAGSGKTTVLINRIANLLKFGSASDSDELPAGVDENDLELLENFAKKPSRETAERAFELCVLNPVDPWRVIAITFTNKAASEIKNRIETMLGEHALDIWASTFHSACVRILRRDIEKLGVFSSSFNIYDTADSLSLIKTIIKDMELDEKAFAPRSVLSAISSSKDDMLSASSYLDSLSNSRDIRRKQIGQIYLEYEKRMTNANALDFDDLILWTVKLLTDSSDAREYYQNKFKYVMVDEYQDTNNLQYKLVSLLAGKWGNICVVGDDDQGIYRFRGASIENILNFEHQYRSARVIRLEQNYRSTGHILEAANAVIAHNEDRKGKKLWTNNERGEMLTLHIAGNETEEAQYVASCMMESFAAGYNWRDFAVLYRMNAQSNQLEYAFKRNGIPYRIVGGMKFFERAEIKDMLAYLSFINNVNDDLRLTRIINNPPRGIGAKTVDTVTQIASANSTGMYEILKRSKEFDELAKSSPRLLAFVNLIEDMRQMLTGALDELYDMLLEKSGYLTALKEKNNAESETRIENIMELKTSIITFMSESGGTLSDYLAEVALYTDIDQYDDNADFAVMMTIHSSKGLEFPTVFLVGAEEGIFPGMRSSGEIEEMEEERRLCYVAITRAKKKLHITAAKQRMLFGRTSSNRLSRFIDEIPDDNIVKPEPANPYIEVFDGGYIKDTSTVRTVRTAKPVPEPSIKPRIIVKKEDTTVYKPGDNIIHTAFGVGVIMSSSKMGGDTLIEIEFESSGTKRLLLNSASKHMQRL